MDTTTRLISRLILFALLSATAFSQTSRRPSPILEQFPPATKTLQLFKTESRNAKTISIQGGDYVIENIDLPQSEGGLAISFQSKTPSGGTNAELLVSKDSGVSWHLLTLIDGNDDSVPETVFASLTEFAGQSIALKFRADFPQNWVIDDLQILQFPQPSQPAAKALVVDIKSLDARLFPLIFMNATVEQDGQEVPTLTQNDFSVMENGVLQTDLFQVIPPGTAGGARLADVVFIMDNSGSLGDEQASVETNMIAFVDGLVNSGVDFALGLCRYGQSQNGGNPIIEDNGQLTSDADYFKNDVWKRNVASGSRERGYYSIVQSATLFNFRPGAQKVFIIITDEAGDQGLATQQEAIDICVNNSIVVYGLLNQIFIDANTDLAAVTIPTGGKNFNITAPFTDILTDIQNAVANTYVIRYQSSDPVVNAIERKVELTANHQSGQAFDTGFYTPGANPVIERDQPTKDLSKQGWTPGTVFDITVNVTDAAAPFTQNVTLFYRTSGAANYASTPMQKVAAPAKTSLNADVSQWTAQIPANFVLQPGVDYYITASDGIVTTSNPETNPTAQPHQIAVLPNEPPKLTHTPPANYIPGIPLKISATASDQTNLLSGVKLFYRTFGEILFKSLAMINVGGDNYEASIPAEALTQDGVDYFIVATDDFNVSTVLRFSLAARGVVTLTAPNGGEKWQAGVVQNIVWQSIKVNAVRLEYSSDNGANWNLIADNVAAATGSYAWTVPNLSTQQALVRITDVGDAAVTDQSDAVFEIFSGSVTVTTPNGGESYRGGTTQEIRWESQGVENVTLEYSMDGGQLWAVIAASHPTSTQPYLWKTPNAAATQALIRVSDASNASVNDVSDAPFSIVPVTLNVLSPNGGEDYQIGSLQLISWEVDGVENIKIEYSVNGGATWDVIAEVIPASGAISTQNFIRESTGYLNDDSVSKPTLVKKSPETILQTAKNGKAGSFIWETPNEPTDDALIRISDVAQPEISDVSDTPFVISDLPNFADWINYIKVNSGLLENYVRALTFDWEGNIWIGSRDYGVLKFDGNPDGGAWINYNAENSLLPSNSILSLAGDKWGNVWIGTNGAGVAVYSADGFEVFNTDNSGLPSNRIWAIFPDHFLGKIWFGTSAGLACFNGEEWVIFNIAEDGLPSNIIYAVYASLFGDVWAGTPDGLAYLSEEGVATFSTENSGLPDNTIFALGLDPDDNLWMGTAQGLAVSDGENWETFTSENSELPHNAIRSIQIDGAGNKWIGTWGGGLAKFNEAWKIFETVNSGLLDDYVISLAIGPNGFKWVGTETGGLAQYLGDPALLVSVENGLETDVIPTEFALSQNFPNPFNPATLIRFQLPEKSGVSLKIFNSAGQLVRTLASGEFVAGSHEMTWNGRDDAGRKVASGVYVYRLRSGDFSGSKKMLLMK